MQSPDDVLRGTKYKEEETDSSTESSAESKLSQIDFFSHESEPKSKIKKLVFQGGSVKGFAYIGALDKLLKELDEKIFNLEGIEEVARTSVGAISAMLVGCGYNFKELKTLLENFDVIKYLDEPIDAENLFSKLFSIKKSIAWGLIKEFLGYPLAGSLLKQSVQQLKATKGLFSGEKFGSG